FKNRIRYPSNRHGAHLLKRPLRIVTKIFVEDHPLPWAVNIKKLSMLIQKRLVVDERRLITLLSDRIESCVRVRFWHQHQIKQIARSLRRVEMRLTDDFVLLNDCRHGLSEL